MNYKLATLAGLSALIIGSQALAETCNVESIRAPGEYLFIKVFDPDTGEIVLQRAIKGGTPIEVTVSGERVRVDSKLPGGVDYKPGAIATCKSGNTIKL